MLRTLFAGAAVLAIAAAPLAAQEGQPTWARTSAEGLAELKSLSPVDTSALQASR